MAQTAWMRMFVGVDCGTQSSKVVILDPDTLSVRGHGSCAHDMISGDNGRREQRPQWWIDAFETAFNAAIKDANISPRAVRGIGISGQQHGLVALDAQGRPVYPAKLWCDTETAPENAALVAALGGETGCLDALGVAPQPGFTASKIAWLRAHQRDAYDRIATVMLPHDYLNFYLTGRRVAESGDASGTGYFDTRARRWHHDAFAQVAPELDPERVLPELIGHDEPAGTVRAAVAERLGLADDVIVSAGGGDNMMGAIGTGNIQAGVVTMSLGTSGTIFAHSDTPAVSADGLVANFCASHDGWLPLICTMNVTSATTQLREVLGMNLAQFTEAVTDAPLGAGGITLLPFFNGERVPALPDATGSFLGLHSHNFSRANLCRAALEGATFGLRYGMDRLNALGIAPTELRLVGGGARSAIWRQIVADVMDAELICPTFDEAAALGAALQARFCHDRQAGDSTTLAELCDTAVALDEATHCTPQPADVDSYRDVYAHYHERLDAHYPQIADA
ncbi:xylulokinase [Salinisphaera aquimarina]|uniref:Xylulose kinase n=1 Tax=Salinisphaera aquimarina TaxID=2094031 RepID=A0ABV7EK85_9GAMM